MDKLTNIINDRSYPASSFGITKIMPQSRDSRKEEACNSEEVGDGKAD